jgi:hypothetical protein
VIENDGGAIVSCGANYWHELIRFAALVQHGVIDRQDP